MPSLLHEALILLLARAPRLIVELLGPALGLTPDAEVVVCDPVAHAPVPTERRADLVLEVRARAGLRAVVVEVQLTPDPEKVDVWPYYVMGERLRHHGPASLAVIAPDPAVAAWAARPIATGQPGCTFTPVVLGRSGIPWVTAPDVETPERVVLSALAHGDEPDGERVIAALAETLASLDDDLRAQYYCIVHDCLGEAMRRKLEELMFPAWLEQTAKARELIAKGEARGEAVGEVRGRLAAKIEALLAICETRGLALSDADRERVQACTDLPTRDSGIRRAARAAAAAELFD